MLSAIHYRYQKNYVSFFKKERTYAWHLKDFSWMSIQLTWILISRFQFLSSIPIQLN